MNRKYALKLAVDERAWLEALVRKGKSAAWKIQYADAFFKIIRIEHGPRLEVTRIVDVSGMTTRSAVD